MTDYFLSGVRSLVSTSPSAAVGVTQALGPPVLTGQPSDWTYEKLSVIPNPTLIEVLASVPGRLEAKSVSADAVIPALVKLFGASNHAGVKAGVCAVIVSIAGGKGENADVGLLIVNILMQDLHDPNPENRANAVTTICSLPVLVQSYAVQAVSTGLKDSNPTVRKQAVIGCGRAWSHYPDFITGSGLIDQLYTMIRDPEPTVLTFALQTLNIILKSEGGVVMNNAMIHYLLTRLVDCLEVELILLLNYLRLNRTKKDKGRVETSLKIMNACDAYLDAKNGSLALAAMYLFTDCIRTLGDEVNENNVVADFMAKAKPQISRFLNLKGHSNDDFKVSLMEFILEMPASAVVFLLDIIDDFHLKSKDCSAVANSKLQCLSYLFKQTCHSHDPSIVIDYLLQTLPRTKEKLVSRTIMSTLCELDGICHQRQLSVGEWTSQRVFEAFLALIEGYKCEDDVLGFWEHFHAEKLNTGHDLAPDFVEKFANAICEKALACLNSGQGSAELVRQLLHFLSNHPELDMAPYYLEAVLDDLDRVFVVAGESDSEIMKQCLYEEMFFSAFNVTMKQPAPTQHILARIVSKCKSTGVPELCERIDCTLRTAASSVNKSV